MRITFDPAKREQTLTERGLDFAEAAEVFSGLTATIEDDRRPYPEARYITAGFMADRLVVVVWTPIGDGRRVISMRHAHEREIRRWLKQMG
jgi:uncharacterized DUF497 family protein